MALLLDNVAGLIPAATPLVIMEGPDSGRIAVRRITLLNSTTTRVDFTLRLIYTDEILEEEPITLFDDHVPAQDSWTFGAFGGVIFIKAEQRLECVLDSAPTSPIQYSMDFGITT